MPVVIGLRRVFLKTTLNVPTRLTAVWAAEVRGAVHHLPIQSVALVTV